MTHVLADHGRRQPKFLGGGGKRAEIGGLHEDGHAGQSVHDYKPVVFLERTFSRVYSPRVTINIAESARGGRRCSSISRKCPRRSDTNCYWRLCCRGRSRGSRPGTPAAPSTLPPFRSSMSLATTPRRLGSASAAKGRVNPKTRANIRANEQFVVNL